MPHRVLLPWKDHRPGDESYKHDSGEKTLDMMAEVPASDNRLLPGNLSGYLLVEKTIADISQY